MASRIVLVLFFLCVGVSAFAEAGRVENHIQVEAQLVYLRRTKSDEKCFARVDASKENTTNSILPGDCGCPCACKVNAKDLIHDFHFQPGVRGTVTIMPNQDYSIEGRYLSEFQWKGEKSKQCISGLNFPFDPNETEDWRLASAARAQYTTDLWSTEFNYWRHVTPRRVNYFSISWVVGLRYLELNDDLKITYRKRSHLSDYRIKTRNHIGGVQIGGDFQANPYKQVVWGLSGKMGLMANYCDQLTRLSDINNAVLLRNFNPEGWRFTWVGEIAPFFTLYFFPQMYLKLSYEVLFIYNAALAPNQVGYTDSGSALNDNGRPLYHGAYGGLGLDF